MLYPEHSHYGLAQELVAFEASDASFLLEADFNHLSGPGVALIHDTTLDRTTDGTGNVSAVTEAALAGVTIDQYPSLPIPTHQRKVPTGVQFFTMYANQWAAAVEPKSSTAATRALLHVQQYGLEESVLPNSDELSLIQPFLDEDIPSMLNNPGTSGMTPAEIAAAGVTWVQFGSAADPDPQDSADMVDLYEAEGLKVWVSTSSRHQWAVWRQAGARGGFAGDPTWLTGDGETTTTLDFAERRFLPGHHPYVGREPGHIIDLGGGVWAWAPTADTDGWTLFGALHLPGKTIVGWDHRTGVIETQPAVYPIGFEADVTYLSAGATPTRRVGFALTDDDEGYNDTVTGGARQGLYFHLAPDGTLYIGERDGNTENELGTLATDAVSVNDKIRLRVERLSATQARLTRLDTDDALTVTTTSDIGSGGYPHFGNPGVSGATGRWAISDPEAIT